MIAMKLNPSTTRDLETLFRADAAALGARRDVGGVFTQLRAAYEDQSRRYHSLEHIAECLAMLEDERSTLESPAEVAMAIWFHDAVYATYPLSSSEERSAGFAEASCTRLGIAGPSAVRIAAMVRATKDHDLTSDGARAAVHERDALTLFDIDLAILGAEPVRYARYERDVRAEYAWVLDGIFRSRRAKVLRAFAARPAIFRTPRLHDRLEAPARTNIDRAVIELTSKIDEAVLHATDNYLFVTRAARLEALHSWSELYYACILSTPLMPARLCLAFSPEDDRGLQIRLDAPHAHEVVDRVRSIPDYDHDAEQRALRREGPGIVYSRERHRAVTCPLSARARAAYRENL
jgi:predicted metal-dependent HD superfamily phosphohydrolase